MDIVPPLRQSFDNPIGHILHCRSKLYSCFPPRIPRVRLWHCGSLGLATLIRSARGGHQRHTLSSQDPMPSLAANYVPKMHYTRRKGLVLLPSCNSLTPHTEENQPEFCNAALWWHSPSLAPAEWFVSRSGKSTCRAVLGAPRGQTKVQTFITYSHVTLHPLSAAKEYHPT